MMGGAGETPFEVRRRLLNDRERQLTKMLESVVERRAAAREGRRQRLGMPVVAVVGYTNSGKTSLIKALTNEVGLEPQVRAVFCPSLHPSLNFYVRLLVLLFGYLHLVLSPF